MKSNALKVLIVAVALILPGIAVADVLITGTIGVTGTQNSPQFYFTKGPNFNTIAYGGYIAFLPPTNGKMAEIDLQGINNQSIFGLNALEVAFGSGVSGTFYLNFTGTSTPFPAGSVVFLSTSQVSYSDFAGVGTPGVTPTAVTPGITTVSLHIGATTTIPTSWTVTGSTIIYISYFIPPNPTTYDSEILVNGALVMP